MECPFCKIDNERNRIVKEGKNVFVMLSNPHLMLGHLLVIPKRHVQKLSELTNEERRELLDMIVEFQEKILERVAKGCNVKQNYMPFINDNKLKISHLHIHLYPRNFKDELYNKCEKFQDDIFKDLSAEEADRFLKVFK